MQELLFSNVVKQFVASDKDSEVVELVATQTAIKNLRDRGFSKEQINKNTTIKIRFVKVLLDTGELEVLCTSLLDEQKYPTSCFKELYGMRWGVETYYDVIKNRFLSR